MSEFSIKTNKDDSVFRCIIVALLSELNNEIKFNNRFSDDNIKEVKIPFYFSLTGQERFLLDHFLQDAVVDEINETAIGVYDSIPRGVLTLDGVSIDAGALVNKNIRSVITEEVDSELKMFSYDTLIIPLIFNFNVKILVNNVLEIFKVSESLIKTFYKNKTFYVDLGGYRVAGNIKMPEDFTQNKMLDFGFSDKKEYSLEFPIEINSYMPVFDDKSKVFAGNRIETIIHTTDDISKAPKEDINSNVGVNINTESTGLFPGGLSGEDNENQIIITG